MNNTTSSLEQPQLFDESVATAIEDPIESTEPSLSTSIIEEDTNEETTIASTEVTESDDIEQAFDPMTTTGEESYEPSLATPTIEEETIEETTIASTEITESDDIDQALNPMTTTGEESCEASLATSTIEEETIEETTVSTEATDTTIVDQVGQLTRTLHDSLRELGFDKRLKDISSEVPEAQDKLTYIASKAEQAAERVLTATEIAMPIQEELSSESTNLSKQWKQALESQESSPDDAEKYKNLIINTLAYLDSVPKQADATNAQLMAIMMAQDFQDLTGQVVTKVNKMVKDLEFELLQLLVANVPEDKRSGIDEGLMNGPVVNPEKRDDVVSNQEQVDDLLASMGF